MWVLACVQVLTIRPAQAFSFPEPLSWEHWAVAVVFLATSLGLLGTPPNRIGIGAHAAVVVGLLALHPMTAFGRDGSAVVLMLWLGVVLARMSIRREWLLLLASSAVSLLATEAMLSALRPPDTPVDLPDYGSVMGEYGPCGFLRPDLDVDVIGEDGPARFVTNSLGLRYDREIPASSDESFRILLLGDSFVAGYRTDQQDTLGVRLEALLTEQSEREVEVLPAGAGHPGISLRVAETCGATVDPDLLLIGVTLGNDLSQSWVDHRGFPVEVLDGLFLPPDASKTWLGLLPIKLLRSVRSWRLFRRVEAIVTPEVIGSWFRDAPTAVHLFDPGHSLGHFYVDRELDQTRESFDATSEYLTAIARLARGRDVPAVFALFPQRFQVSDREWEATLFEYGLDPAVFEREAPNRRLMKACGNAGLTCVDLLPAFREAASAGALYQARGDMHWNRRGHAVAARALSDVLAQR
jgi:hypothetical protein